MATTKKKKKIIKKATSDLVKLALDSNNVLFIAA